MYAPSWGAYPRHLSLSGGLDFGTLVQDNIHLSDITPGVPKAGRRLLVQRRPVRAHSYVCDNGLRWSGRTARLCNRVAATRFWLTTGIKTASGGEVQRPRT